MEVEYQSATEHFEHSNNQFNSTLYRQIAKGNNHNVVLSPFSVTSVISMILSKTNAESASLIRSGLSLPRDEYLLPGLNNVLRILNSQLGYNFVFQSANRVYTREEFQARGDFLEINKKYYYLANPDTINFYESEKARVVINHQLEKESHGKLEGPRPKAAFLSADRFSDLVIVNTMYFKGDWDSKFNRNATLPQDFYVEKGRKIEVDMMHKISNCSLFSLVGIDAKAIEIPYKGKQMSMIIILPNDYDGLANLEKDIENFDPTTGFVLEKETDIEIGLPKFRLESTHDLSRPLRELGLQKLFNRKTDLSGISRCKDTFVSNIIQKVFIEVKEDISDASPHRASALPRGEHFSKERPTFICDHPFLFAIKENLTGTVIFSGKVVQPLFK